MEINQYPSKEGTSESLPPLTRDQIAEAYLNQIPFELYPFQEDALLAWFSSEEGVLVCAPTGMGKTLIAEAAMFEALHTGRIAYYTTPLIALTEQKYRELQALAVRWGFRATDVGLVTGNRRENPDATCLVVVAEILANRLLHPERFDFSQVGAVVMDEFHSFADPERGIVWEVTLGLLPKHVRLLLLSATVGNAREFVDWLRTAHNRRVELVEGYERRVPLVFQWAERLLVEQIEEMAQGDETSRKTPALIFCFNREQCWRVAEQIKGRQVLSPGQQAALAAALKHYDLSTGAGPKLRQLLLRGVGVHHAGVLPKYRRIVEDLFQQKLLSVAVCTETLSAGINLPARSVVLPTLLKGPPGKKRLMDASSAHQIFGRAGRPQYDTVGYVFALPHEDDVKLARWKEKYDRIPENTKDPVLLKMKKELERKKPTRSPSEQYWTKEQFEKLQRSPPGKLTSRGPLPWRLLAYMLDASPEVDRIRQLVSKRLMDSRRIQEGQKQLEKMLLVLWRAGYVELEPPPPIRPTVVSGAEGEPAWTPAVSYRRQLPKQEEEGLQWELVRPPVPDSFGAGIFDLQPWELEAMGSPSPASTSEDSASTPGLEALQATSAVSPPELVTPEPEAGLHPGPATTQLDQSLQAELPPAKSSFPSPTSAEEQDFSFQAEPPPAKFSLPADGQPAAQKPAPFGGRSRKGLLDDWLASQGYCLNDQAEQTEATLPEQESIEAGNGLAVSAGSPGSAGTGGAKRSEGEETKAGRSQTDWWEESYRPVLARPTPALRDLLLFRGVNPLYGIFLVRQLGIADRAERIQAFESLLELPWSLGPAVWAPGPDQLPPGPLATNRLDRQLLQLGLATEEELYPPEEEELVQPRRIYDQPRRRLLTLAEKLKLLFDYEHPGVHDVRIRPVWVAGALLEMGGDFDKYIRSRGLETQEGIIFRHLLRLILLVYEFLQFCPPDADEQEWVHDLEDMALRLTVSCRKVDPTSTQRALEEAEADVEIED
ncbi:MAG: DEAD/DEAH box helicase [Thermoguttaceae bacterium]|nr:DEAD/DEAH box helicase [Thermoguttaceae bacterium]MDW8036466.1 DEAD/DEAH box helicase [Thermoguttaceae bacterium]